MTFKLKKAGSLSIPMMCIQTPGSFVFAASLAARLGPSGWSAWGLLLVTGCLQGSLLCMAIYFELNNRKAARAADARNFRVPADVVVSDDEADEQTPLISS